MSRGRASSAFSSTQQQRQQRACIVAHDGCAVDATWTGGGGATWTGGVGATWTGESGGATWPRAGLPSGEWGWTCKPSVPALPGLAASRIAPAVSASAISAPAKARAATWPAWPGGSRAAGTPSSGGRTALGDLNPNSPSGVWSDRRHGARMESAREPMRSVLHVSRKCDCRVHTTRRMTMRYSPNDYVIIAERLCDKRRIACPSRVHERRKRREAPARSGARSCVSFESRAERSLRVMVRFLNGAYFIIQNRWI